MESIKRFREKLLEFNTEKNERFESLKTELLKILDDYENELKGVK